MRTDRFYFTSKANMVGCAAYNCFNNSSCQNTQKKKVTFHRFPLDEGLRKKWINNLKLANFVYSEHKRVCSDHFSQECYEKRHDFMKSFGLSSGNERLTLKQGAIPTIFDFGSPKGHKNMKGRKKFASKKHKLVALSPRKSKFGVSKTSPIKRGAFEKRKKQRIIAALLEAEDSDDTDSDGIIGSITSETTGNESSCLLDTSHQSLEGIADMTSNSYSKGIQTNLPVRNRYTQTSFQGKDVCTQCYLKKPKSDKSTQYEPQISDIKLNMKPNVDSDEIESEQTQPDSCSETDDEEWTPGNDDEDSGEDEAAEKMDRCNALERKYLIFKSCLLQLFAICRLCLAPVAQTDLKENGTMLTVNAMCINGHTFTWKSQPENNRMPWGNFLVAASCLFSGSQPSKVLTFFKHLNLACISERLYSMVQSSYLLPSIFDLWNEYQSEVLSKYKNKELTIGGDGRNDTPGHTAKYGSYSMMDLDSSKILDVQLVQSSECGGSAYMELEGFKRCISTMNRHSIKIGTLVTDRHSQIRKYMRQQHPKTTHYFDVFHVAKGIGKKVEKIGKKKRNSAVLKWVQSIKNHVYWCAASSNGDCVMVAEKWNSLLKHIINVHTGHGAKYKSCQHDKIDRDWLSPGSKGYKELKDKLTKTRLVNDIKKLSPLKQTSALESYHNIVIRFAPKHTHFFYLPMKARLLLASLHFNENSQRKQAQTKEGKEKWKINYRKYKTEGYAQAVKTRTTYGYVSKLMEKAIKKRINKSTYTQAQKEAETTKNTVPDFLTAGKEKLDKNIVVARHKSRFAKKQTAAKRTTTQQASTSSKKRKI